MVKYIIIVKYSTVNQSSLTAWPQLFKRWLPPPPYTHTPKKSKPTCPLSSLIRLETRPSVYWPLGYKPTQNSFWSCISPVIIRILQIPHLRSHLQLNCRYIYMHTVMNMSQFRIWCMLQTYENGSKMHLWENDAVLLWVNHIKISHSPRYEMSKSVRLFAVCKCSLIVLVSR